MKLLHISDLHIGKRVNNMPMMEDQRFIFDEIINIAKREHVEAILIAGDIYDKAAPGAEAVTIFDSFLSELAAEGIKALAIPGNHDSAERIAYVQGLIATHGIYFPPVFSGEVQHVTLEDEHGPVTFWLLPFLKPGDVRRFFPDEEIGDDYSAALRAVLGTCEFDPSQRNIILSHQFVTANGVSPERADDEMKLGGIDNVDVSIYDQFDYVALGHVHRAQRVGRDTVRYAGAPLKYSSSEARYPKSAVLISVGEKTEGDEPGACIEYELVPLEPLHDMRELRGTLDELLAEGEADENRDDYIFAVLTDEHQQLDAITKLREVYPNIMSLEYEHTSFLRNRERTHATVDPEKLDELELFKRFFEEQYGKPMDDEQISIVKRAIQTANEQVAHGDEGEDD